MKKLLVLLALLMALTLAFVACQGTTPPDETTVDDQTTEEPTQGEVPTEEPTDPETPTEEPTETPTEEPTDAPTEKPTEKPTEPETPTEEPTEPETADPMEPVNVFGAEDIQTVTGGDPNNMTQDCLTLEEGYIHVVPLGPDPYWYPFAGVDGARYVAIRYRTDATGADMQLYMSSTGNGPTDDTTMIRQPVIADGEWHVIIFDTQSLIDANLYDGEYVSYFRFDPLEAGYKLDENGQPYKEESGQWARYSLPEGCMIDVAYIGFFHSEAAVAKYDFEQYPPYAQPGEAGLKNLSFDTFYVNNQMYFPEDGGADAKLDAINNTLTFASAAELDIIALRGWIGFDQPIDQFGYYVDNYEFIFGEFKQATEDGVLAAGGEHATRFQINVDLSYLEGDDHFVGFVVKLADGTIVQLREDITIDLPELPKDITDSFIADVNANEVGTTMDASDLANFFVTELPLPGSGVEANGEGKLYHLTSINDMYADVNGRYFFKANVLDSNGAGWMFVRGYKVVNSDAIVEAFDPAGGFYKINNYYETDSAGAMGGAGIYARLQGGKLFIMVKHYNPDTVTRVGNKIYAIDAAGTELTMADNGTTVSILVDGVTYATVELSGSIAYGDINEVDPAGEFAEKAVITLKDGTTETIENTLIAATCECQVGIVARAGSFKFDALAVGGYSAIEVPALEIVTPEEPEPVDPDAPVLVLDPEYINELAGSTEQTVAQHIGSHEIITEDGVTFVRLTSNGGDPYVALVKLGSYLELPPYMAFAYRTNCDLDAHVFIGSGSGWNGQGDVTSVAWNQDNNWNLAVLDLNNAGLTSIQGGIISYCRFDFFTGNGEGNMDVEYVAFFNSAEAAQKYFDKLHGGATDEPETEEPEVPSEPEFYENLVVPQDQWVITGHNTQLNDSTNGMVAAGGVDSAALLHQGSIALGNIDLSKYSKVVVMWGCDNSQVTIDHYNANANNRIMLLNAEMSMVMSPAAETIIAGGTYELKGWKVTAFEIDLTGIDYNGPVWLAIDALPGTFALFSSVEFIGAEKVDEPEHQHEYTTVVTDPTCTEGGYTTYTCACGDSYVADETPAAGHNFVEGSCGICGEADPDYVAPVTMPAEFVLNMYQANKGETLYFTGAMSGYYLATSTNPADAVKMYSEAVEGGYRMYFYDGETKTYVDIVYRDATKANVILTTTPTGVFVWNEEAVTWTVSVADNGKTFYLGTYNSYNTFSTSNISYITGDNAANVGVTQFVAQWADVPAPHEHNYEYETIVIDPTCTEDGYTVHKCECGEGYIDTEIPAAGHNFVDGSCGICGEADPNYEAPGTDEPVGPEAPVVNTLDFSTFAPDNGTATGTSYVDRTNPDGWTATGARIEVSGTDCNGVLGDASVIVLNGKTSALGTLTSPTLTGGISAISFKLAYFWSDTKNIDLTLTITGEDGTVITENVLITSPAQDTAYDYSYTLETPIQGNFTIQIKNNAPSNQDKNKDRAAIWNFTWTSAPAEEPETPDEPAANEIKVTTTDTYGWFDEYTFVANAAGNYTFTLPAGLGMWSVEAYSTWAEPELDYNMITEGGDVTVTLAAGEEFKFLVGAWTKDEWTITCTFAEGEVGGDEPDPEEPTVEILPLVVGSNTIVVTDDILAAQGFETTLVVEVEGNYTFRGDFFVQIYNELGMMVGNGTAYLTPGTYTVRLGTFMLSSAGSYGLIVDLQIPEPEIPEEPDVPTGDPDGTQANPYIITSLPLTINGTGIHDLYYSYTATDVVKLEITYTEGGLITLMGDFMDWDKDEGAMKYIVVVDAGQTLIINPWGNVDATYEITGGGKK